MPPLSPSLRLRAALARFEVKDGSVPNTQEHIAQLLDQLDQLPSRDSDALDALRRRADMIIKRLFGPTSGYVSDLNDIRFHPRIYPADAAYISSTWNSGVARMRNLFNTMAEEVALFGSPQEGESPSTSVNVTVDADGLRNPSIFLVHGHDNQVKVEVARFLELLDLNVVILHEQANAGRTIIEKFEHESADAGFAIVLLTADDTGSSKLDSTAVLPRARQNVVLELGYFLGKLGRSKVAALVHSGVEIPSDFAGVVYIPLDHTESWKLNLAREMKNSGLAVDLNKAI